MIKKKNHTLTKEEIISFLRDNKNLFKKKYHIEKIALFGSYSRNEAQENSDIDLAYEMEPKEKMGYLEFLAIEKFLTQKFKKPIELVDLKYMNPIIKLKAEKELTYV